jgi:hypothetical protein
MAKTSKKATGGTAKPVPGGKSLLPAGGYNTMAPPGGRGQMKGFSMSSKAKTGKTMC